MVAPGTKPVTYRYYKQKTQEMTFYAYTFGDRTKETLPSNEHLDNTDANKTVQQAIANYDQGRQN